MPLPTLADLRPYLNKSSTADDAELQPMLDAAVEIAEGIVGPLSPDTVTETYYGVASRLLVLRKPPVSAVASVTSTVPSGTPVTWTADAYTLDAAAGVLRSVTGLFFGDVTVTYTVTPAPTPASVSEAILVIAAHQWETQRGTSPTPPQLQQPDSGQAYPPGAGYAIPNRARELLTPYVLPNIA